MLEKMATTHQLLNGRLHLYRAPHSQFWQCSASINRKQHRRSTREASLAQAKQIAEAWFFDLYRKARAGPRKTGKTFEAAARQFIKTRGATRPDQLNARALVAHEARLRLHLLPFFGDLRLSEITIGKIQEYRLFRALSGRDGKAPARRTIRNEIMTLRLVLTTAVCLGWLDQLPDLFPPQTRHRQLKELPAAVAKSPRRIRGLQEGPSINRRRAPFDGATSTAANFL
jgi:hypothetical protein